MRLTNGLAASTYGLALALTIGCGGGGGSDKDKTSASTAGATTTTGGSTGTTGGSTGTTTGGSTAGGNVAANDVSVQFAPTGKQKLMQKTIVAEIQAAKKSIDVATFIFTSDTLADALLDAKKRGVQVRVMYDSGTANFIGSSTDGALKKAGVGVLLVKTPGTAQGKKFHHKFCVIDGTTVLTGSYNWTVDADESNHENLVTIRDAAIAQIYAKEFEDIYSGGPGGTQSAGDVVFSPSGKAEAIQKRIAAELDKAKSEVVLAMYLFTSSDVQKAVERALKRGVKFTALFDNRQSAFSKDAINALVKGGADVKKVYLGGSGIHATDFHHKFAVIDGQTVITGSFNWNVNQDQDGWENIVVLREQGLAQKFLKQFADIWSSPVAK